MKTTGAKCKIDGVMVGEMEISLLGPRPSVTIKYALVNSSTGSTYGSGTVREFSPTTVEKFKEFIGSVEEDILTLLFDKTEPTAASSPQEKKEQLEDKIPEL